MGYYLSSQHAVEAETGVADFLDDAEHATILAALRFYQEKGQGDPANRSEMIDDIATKGHQVVSLDANAIDDLCERINF